MTYLVLSTDGRTFPVYAAGYGHVGDRVEFWWLDENGYRYPAATLRAAEVRAIRLEG